jgi:hypothetical protein
MNVSIANPGARIIERGDVIWAAAGLDGSGQRMLEAAPSRDSGIEAALCQRAGDVSIIRVLRTARSAGRLTAWKGLTSGHEVFYCATRGREPIVSDHFRNVLACIPLQERAPSPEALCDHFLFRTVPAPNTLCSGVKRLGRGERVDIDPDSHRVRTRQFDRIEDQADATDWPSYLQRIDDALEAVLEPLREQPGVAVLFSGGVDSTLLRTYLDNATLVNYRLPANAGNLETAHADQAAALLGLPLETLDVRTDDYVERLERAIATAGMPPPHVQLAFHQSLFDLDHRDFVMGEQANALLCMDLRRIGRSAPFASRAGTLILTGAAAVCFGRPRRRLNALRETAARLTRPPQSTEGYGARFRVHGDVGLLERLFGAELVHSRLLARLAAVTARYEPSADPAEPLLRHLETAQMVDYLGEDIMMCFRHLAHPAGRTVSSPFLSRHLLDATLSVPVTHRYLRDHQGKVLLRALLQRRLPAYPVTQRMGPTHAPLADLFPAETLARMWRQYPPPRPCSDKDEGVEALQTPTPLAWKALIFALWQHQVREQGRVQPVPGSRTLSLEAVG